MNWITISNPLFASGPNDGFAKFHWEYTNATPPDELFHYTSEENLTNILKFGNLWATECTFLNDGSELLAGINVFREAVKSFHVPVFIELVNSALTKWNDDSWMYFVISLSEDGDLLSQWRAYANDGMGCSIALDAKCIRGRAGFGEFVGLDADKLPKETSNFYHLLKVVYENEAKLEIAHQFLQQAKLQFDEFDLGNPKSDTKDLETFVLISALRLKEFIISFKNEEFSEEREWRVVSSLHRNDPAIASRHTGYGIAPYTKTNLSPRDEINASRLPVKEIILGPRNRTKLNQKGLALFLKQMKCDARIALSKSSYR